MSRKHTLGSLRGIPSPTPANHPRAAFSLVEMLIVVSIISMLLAMLYSAIRSVQRYSRESVTRGELKSIESALKQYYAHYQCWPTGTWTTVSESAAGDVQYALDAPFARLLEGSNSVYNSESVTFLELSRFNDYGVPVNAWATPKGTPYTMMFDLNGDNQLSVVTNTSTTPPMRGTVFRSVAVWTEHPDKPGRVLGSWER